MGQTRVGLVTKGWGGSCRGEVGHAGWGQVGYTEAGWGGS